MRICLVIAPTASLGNLSYQLIASLSFVCSLVIVPVIFFVNSSRQLIAHNLEVPFDLRSLSQNYQI